MMTTDATTATVDNTDNLVADSSASDIHEDLQLFVGKNIGEYKRLIDIYAEETESNRTGFKFSYALTGFFAPWLWMLYRKMYLLSLLVFCLQLIGSYFGLGPLFFLALSIATLLAGKTIYIRSAVKTVRQIRANAPSPEQALAEIERKGGTNILGWVLGILIYGGVLLIGTLTLLGQA